MTTAQIIRNKQQRSAVCKSLPRWDIVQREWCCSLSLLWNAAVYIDWNLGLSFFDGLNIKNNFVELTELSKDATQNVKSPSNGSSKNSDQLPFLWQWEAGSFVAALKRCHLSLEWTLHTGTMTLLNVPHTVCSDIKTESSPLIVKAVSSKISLTYGKQSGTLWRWALTTLGKSSDYENQFVHVDIKASRLVSRPHRNPRPLSLSLMTAEVKRPPNNFTQTPDISSVQTTPSA